MLDNPTILTCLGKLEEFFGHQLSPDVRNMYVEHLRDLSEDDFKKSVVMVMREFKPTSARPFPLVADILEMCGQDSQSKAVNVVTMVKEAAEKYGQYRSMDFGDRAIHSVIKRYGGWEKVVFWGEKDWQFHERNFIAAYKAAKAAGIGPDHVAGLVEIDSKMNGYDVKPPVLLTGQRTLSLAASQPANQPVARLEVGPNGKIVEAGSIDTTEPPQASNGGV